MSSFVLINKENYISQNQYKVNLPSSIDLNDYECAVASGFVYFAWFSISSQFNNNTFQLRVPSGASYNDYTIIIPDGSYNISDLNNYLQYWFIENDLYLTNDSDATYKYYASFQLSPTSYSVMWITEPIPTTVPSGYTKPSGFTLPTSANQHIQLTVLDNGFKNIIGYTPATYPTSATNSGVQTANSSVAPDVNPISSVQMRLSCVYNALSSNTQLLHVFTNNSRFGSLIDISPSESHFVPCSGIHKELVLGFYTNTGAPLQLLDRNITIKLIFRKKKSN